MRRDSSSDEPTFKSRLMSEKGVTDYVRKKVVENDAAESLVE
jgi:hypothetical protein